MAGLITGSFLRGLEVDKIDSIRPIVITTSKILDPLTDNLLMCDPTSGNIILTLPDATTSYGVMFYIKRIINGDNFVAVQPAGTDTIDNGSTSILGNENEFIVITSYGTSNWAILDRRTYAIAAMQFIDVSPATQPITTAFQSIDVWNTDAFSTSGRVISNSGANAIQVLNIQNAVQDGYRVSFAASFQYANNIGVDFSVFVNGIQTSLGSRVTGAGATDIGVSGEGIVGVLAPTVPQNIEVRVKADSANTITYQSEMALTVERLGG